jgi:hypothetical protein
MRSAALALVLASLVACGPKQSEDGDTSGTTATGGTTGEAPQSTDSDTVLVLTTQVTESDTSPPDMCPDPNSTYSDGQCFCKAFYDWCNPDDPDDLSCCESAPSTTSPTTGPGDTGDTGDLTTGAPACTTAPSGACDPDVDNLACDDGPDCNVETSTLYACIDGMWQAKPEFGDAACKQLGHDFAFGCNSHIEGLVGCGDGPGTACTPDDPKFCSDATTLLDCVHAKQTELDCDAACKQGAVDQTEHDGGYCMQSRISSSCTCCDDPDCP